MKKSGRIGSVMAASDKNKDAVITKDEWNDMFSIMNSTHGKPDKAAVAYAKAVLMAVSGSS